MIYFASPMTNSQRRSRVDRGAVLLAVLCTSASLLAACQRNRPAESQDPMLLNQDSVSHSGTSTAAPLTATAGATETELPDTALTEPELSVIHLTLPQVNPVTDSPVSEPPTTAVPVTSPAPATTVTSTTTAALEATALPATTSPATTSPATTAAPETPAPLQSPDGRSGSELDYPAVINGVILVNKNHWVSRNYAPVQADYFDDRWKLAPEAWTAWEEMKAAAAEEGVFLIFTSGYRSYDYQAFLYDNYVKTYGQVQADRSSAKPGRSEHQTGLALDITGDGVAFSEDLAETAVGKWLHANAWRFGWILRYPREKEHITGYKFEPWHYRYVGKAVAADFGPNNTLTLEEYLGVD